MRGVEGGGAGGKGGKVCKKGEKFRILSRAAILQGLLNRYAGSLQGMAKKEMTEGDTDNGQGQGTDVGFFLVGFCGLWFLGVVGGGCIVNRL